MNELLQIYLWTIIAGVVAGLALALVGCQVAARDKAMQALCQGQGSMLGVLLGIAAIGLSHDDSELVGHAAPFIAAALTAALVTMLGEAIVRHKHTSKNSYFTALFALLLAVNYLISAVFPGLESHVSQVFFGDLATLNEFDIRLTLVFAALTVVVLALKWRAVTNRSFELATFGERTGRKGFLGIQSAVDVLMFLYVCFCIQFLGFLFTIANLFLPTAILSFGNIIGLKRHLSLAAVLSALACLFGFLLSLENTRLPTVPTIVTMMIVVGLCILPVARMFLSGARRF